MAFSIGRPILNPNACGIMAWETANTLRETPDTVFMNISTDSGEEIYKKARSNTNIVFQKALEDKSKPDEKSIVNVYLPKYTNKVVVEGNSVEKFLGHYSLATTVQSFAAGIIFIKESPGAWSNVLCVVSGENRPTYIFDAGKGTIERTDNLYDTIFNYVQNTMQTTLSAYIVSTGSTPVVFKADTPILVEDEDPKPAKEEKHSSPKKKKKKKEEEEKEEKSSSPKKSSSKKKRERSPSLEETQKKEEEEEEQEEKKTRKRPAVRRRKLAEIKVEKKE